MKKFVLALFLLFTGVSSTQLSGTVSNEQDLTSPILKGSKFKHKKHRHPKWVRGPQGPNGDKGDTGRAGSIATEYMNLSYPISNEALEYEEEPFMFKFSRRSPDTNNIVYTSGDQTPYITLKPGTYLVSYDLHGYLGYRAPSMEAAVKMRIGSPHHDLTPGWVVELVAFKDNSEIPDVLQKTTVVPSCVSAIERNVDEKIFYSIHSSVVLSRSFVLEIPKRSSWHLALRSVEYPKFGGKRRYSPCLPDNGRLLEKLFFFGSSSSPSSPINLSIVRIGESS